MTVSNPVIAWVASLQALTGIGVSTNLYFSVNLTAGWEIRVPVQIRMSTVSADPTVTIYPSHDGGGTYDTTPMTGFSISRVPAASVQASVALPTGQYLLQVFNTGPSSASVAVLTAEVITAINNV